jgi:hypothetical protein
MNNFASYVKTYILKSWKTTVAGITLFVIGYLTTTGKITAATAGTITTVLAGFGFVVSKDGNATGTN